MFYKFFLLDSEARVRAAESFTAATDAMARAIADAVYDACADIFDGFELWRGSACLTRLQHAQNRPAQPQLSQAGAEAAALARRLSRSFTCMHQSLRLQRSFA